jgi:hypothetical protein
MAAEKERAKVLIASKWSGSHLQLLSIGAYFHSPLSITLPLSQVKIFFKYIEQKYLNLQNQFNI